MSAVGPAERRPAQGLEVVEGLVGLRRYKLCVCVCRVQGGTWGYHMGIFSVLLPGCVVGIKRATILKS